MQGTRPQQKVYKQWVVQENCRVSLTSKFQSSYDAVQALTCKPRRARRGCRCSTGCMYCSVCLTTDSEDATQPDVDILTQEEMINWLKTTNAELTFVGNPIPGVNAPEGLVSREALDTTVTYCSQRIDSVCGGACTVYTGGATCLNAPDTNCLAATNNVGFCDRAGYVVGEG